MDSTNSFKHFTEKAGITNGSTVNVRFDLKMDTSGHNRLFVLPLYESFFDHVQTSVAVGEESKLYGMFT